MHLIAELAIRVACVVGFLLAFRFRLRAHPFRHSPRRPAQPPSPDSPTPNAHSQQPRSPHRHRNRNRTHRHGYRRAKVCAGQQRGGSREERGGKTAGDEAAAPSTRRGRMSSPISDRRCSLRPGPGRPRHRRQDRCGRGEDRRVTHQKWLGSDDREREAAAAAEREGSLQSQRDADERQRQRQQQRIDG